MALSISPQTDKQADRPVRSLEQSGLELRLNASENPNVIGREAVTQLDFSDPLAEVWREQRLRKGVMGPSPTNPDATVSPIFDEDSASRCLGYTIELPDPNGGTAQTVFSMKSLEDVAIRAADGLIAAGKMQKNDQFHYHLHFNPSPPLAGEDSTSGKPPLLNGTIRKLAQHYLQAELKPLMDVARPSDPLPDMAAEENPFPVFFTEEAFSMAERFSRKGSTINPLFESGAILVGSLCSCPETGEFFCVVSEVFEVKDAEQTLTSLTYSGKSWSRIQNIIRARNSSQPALRILGQAHGHNFLPNDGKTCQACPTLPVCNLNNLFASRDDQTWSRATFSGLPWRLCLIYGMTARGDRLNGLFGLHDGRLRLRGFHLLPDFNLNQYPTMTIS